MSSMLSGRSWQRLVCCIFLISMVGCGRRDLPPPPPVSGQGAVRGTVDLSVLEQANPQHVFLDRVDAAIATTRRPYEAGARIDGETAATAGAAAGRMDIALLHSPPHRALRIAGKQKETLAELQAEIVKNLALRLQRADDQRLAAIRAQLDAAVQQMYLGKVDAINDQADIRVDRIAEEDSDRAVNLLTKIKALTTDIDPPPTAPVGYWSNRLQLRQEEFKALENRRSGLISQIQSQRDQSRKDLQAELAADADESYALARATSEIRRAQVLSMATARLERQTSNILASSKLLDEQADALSDREALMDENNSPPDHRMSSSQTLERSASRRDIAALMEERGRLQGQIDRQTRQTIIQVARLRNVKVVGYQHEKGVPDMTGQMMRWVRADRWG